MHKQMMEGEYFPHYTLTDFGRQIKKWHKTAIESQIARES